MTACGEVQSDKKSLLDWCKQHGDWPTFRVTSTAGREVFARVRLGGKSGKHCHVDLASPDYFDELPKARTEAEFNDIMSPLIGESIELSVRCRFALEVDRLPAIIKASRKIVSSESGVIVRMSGGRFTVEGAPIYSIEWNVDEGDEDGSLVIRAKTNLPITEDYLLECFRLVRASYEAFIGAGVSNVRDQRRDS